MIGAYNHGFLSKSKQGGRGLIGKLVTSNLELANFDVAHLGGTIPVPGGLFLGFHKSG